MCEQVSKSKDWQLLYWPMSKLLSILTYLLLLTYKDGHSKTFSVRSFSYLQLFAFTFSHHSSYYIFFVQSIKPGQKRNKWTFYKPQQYNLSRDKTCNIQDDLASTVIIGNSYCRSSTSSTSNSTTTILLVT